MDTVACITKKYRTNKIEMSGAYITKKKKKKKKNMYVLNTALWS